MVPEGSMQASKWKRSTVLQAMRHLLTVLQTACLDSSTGTVVVVDLL